MSFKLNEITLRTVTHDDIAEVARMWNFGGGEISLEEAAKAIEKMQANHQQNRLHAIFHACFAVFENSTGRIIGWCGLDGKNGSRVNIFYLIDEGYRGRGYATQCAKALLEYGFREMQVARIDGECVADNLPSKRVLEKIGMKATAADPDTWHYYLTLDDYTG